jgi:nitrogen fixation protein NifU and related proteins
MATLDALYQDLILDHNRKPRNYRSMKDANRSAEGNNPLCGDRLIVWLLMDGDTIQDISFEGNGCAISRASASLMTTAVAGKTRQEAESLFERFHGLVTGSLHPSDGHELGKLIAFKGVSAYPVRVKCASLAWHALKAAMEQPNALVSTE